MNARLGPFLSNIFLQKLKGLLRQKKGGPDRQALDSDPDAAKQHGSDLIRKTMRYVTFL
jgi:hypothetical protein